MGIFKSIGSYTGSTLIKIGQKLQTKAFNSFNRIGLRGFSSNFITTGTPVWRDLGTAQYLLDCYCQNPVVQAVINIKADAFSNIKFIVKDLESGELTPLDEYDKDGGKLKTLLAKPNPLQSQFEWLKQLKVNREVFGNSYSYASVPSGFENNFDYTNINVINNLPTAFISPILTGKWLEQTDINEIIKAYQFTGFNNKIKTFQPQTILHTNSVNIKFDEHFTEGVSELIALQRPISNIDLAYESKNVLIKRRGALGILSSKAVDSLGSVPLQPNDIEKVQEDYRKYGTLGDQHKLLISHVPLDYQQMAMSVKDLMLFEEIESSGIAVCNGFGVPESLVRYYIKKGSLGTDSDVDEKRLYDSTTIPESKEFMITFNNFLKTSELGIELLGSFDHIKVLQKNQREEATTNKINEARAMSAFKIASITYGTYLQESNLPPNDKMADKTILDLTDEERQIIGITVNTQSNEN